METLTRTSQGCHGDVNHHWQLGVWDYLWTGTICWKINRLVRGVQTFHCELCVESFILGLSHVGRNVNLIGNGTDIFPQDYGVGKHVQQY